MERLLLVVEEIGCTALRHGRGPVDITVSTVDHDWRADVGDTDLGATDFRGGSGRRPRWPGLYRVGRTWGAHGRYAEGTRKVAWAADRPHPGKRLLQR